MYVDVYFFPLHEDHIDLYQEVAQQVGAIWKEYGALSYQEFVGDDLQLKGVRSFVDAVE